MAESERNKIVIVEDEGLIAADLRGRLTASGYSVTAIASSGTEALRMIRQTSPDLVLMDIRIKGNQDGIQVAQRVREEFDIPVVYLTAYDDRGTLERAAGTQAYGYIKKPIASASLQGSIELALAKHSRERQLREQRDWALASFGAVPYAVLVTDRLGRLSFLNAISEELIGCTADRALGRQSTELLRIVYRESGEPVEDLVDLTIRGGEGVPFPADVWLDRGELSSCPVEGIVAPRRCGRRVDGTVIEHARTVLAAVRAPLLIIQSTTVNAERKRLPLGADETTPWLELVRASVPGARIEVVADAGHFPQIERPEEVNRLLAGFLAGLSR